MAIDFSLSNVAGIAVAPIDASATISVGGLGGTSVFCGIVVSQRGAPNTVLHITKDNWQEVLGKPLATSEGTESEGMRHIFEAIKNGEGYVVRAVATDALKPVLHIQENKELGAVIDTTVVNTAALESEPLLLPDDWMILYPIDGDPSENRSISIGKASTTEHGENVYELTLFDKDLVGNDVEIETHFVSFDESGVDVYGKSNYIVDALMSNSKYIRAKINKDKKPAPSAPKGIISTRLSIISAEGKATVTGTNGTIASITNDQKLKAINVLRNSMAGFTAVLGLGQYDGVILGKLSDISKERRIDAFFDVKPNQNYSTAIDEVKALGIDNHRVCVYHMPYRAKDPFFGNSAFWGLSGVAFSAKAKGVAKSVGGTGGWHYSPAGVERGVIPRSELVLRDGIDTPNYEDMYKSRLNKLGVTPSGLLMIDDAITLRQRDDYLLYQHVSSLMDAISRRFYALATQIKHEPDGITAKALSRGMRAICEDFVSIGALVTPRNPEDGTEPYKIEIKQVGLDQWSVHWAVCPVGVARRIIGEPALIR